MIWKIFLFLLLCFVSIAGIAFPIVQSPTKWYEFPFIMSTIFSIQYLRKKNLDDDAKSYAAAQLGIIFCILATVTGSVWSKFAWGSFWSWDPRQTSIFALLLIYGAWFALRSAIESEDKRATLSAVYSIIAFLTVPFFIFIMPRIMTGLHPGSADDTNAGPIVDFKMNFSMQLIFFLSMIGFTILYFWMWNLGYKSIILNEKINKQLTRG